MTVGVASFRVRAAAAVRAVVAALVVATALTACSTKQVETTTSARGGTLTVLAGEKVASWDPQQVESAPAGAFATRTYLRTLTTQAPGGVGFSSGLIPDLATTTGYPSEDGLSWRFSLGSNARWQDNRFVTCEDVRYGVSRAFADAVTPATPGTGSWYARTLLDIPSTTSADGSVHSAYAGPYAGTGQALFDAAVSCTDDQITFKLKAPRADFDEIVSLPAFGPYRKDVDPRLTGVNADPDHWVFSCGPYMLEGLWDPEKAVGGRFVRNRNWVSLLDHVRDAYPDVIEVQDHGPATADLQRIVDDGGPPSSGRTSVTWSSAPAAMFAQLGAAPVSDRVTNPDSPTVDLLVPAPSSSALSVPAVRQAFAMATDRQAYSDAYGGEKAVLPTASAIPRAIAGHQDLQPFGVGLAGDPAAAAAVLAKAGVPAPVAVTVTRPSSPQAEQALEAMTGAWSKAGFAVTVVATGGDLSWSSVSAAVPTAGAVLPLALAGSMGSTVPALAAELATANAEVDPSLRAEKWGALDAESVTAGRYIALGQHRHLFVHGSDVLRAEDDIAQGGFVDVAGLQVVH